MATQANCLPMNKVKLLNLKIILKMYKIMFISFAYLEFIKLLIYIYYNIIFLFLSNQCANFRSKFAFIFSFCLILVC